MEQSKTGLRRHLKQARLATSTEERTTKSAAIRQRLNSAIDWSKVSTVHYFEPIQSLGEVDICPLVDDKHAFTSRLVEGEWQIVALDGKSPVPDKFDVIIVPMLAFDKDLNRIGYGGGYYDKFLASQPNAQKIGVCFEIGKVEQIPVEPHDVALNVIVTESATYTPASTPKGV